MTHDRFIAAAFREWAGAVGNEEVGYEASQWIESRAAELARESVGDGDDWLPIDTAPKDGSMYLCWVDAIRYGERDDGSLDQADVSEVDFGQWREFESGGAHINMMGDIGDGQQITHWQPLPQRPNQTITAWNTLQCAEPSSAVLPWRCACLNRRCQRRHVP